MQCMRTALPSCLRAKIDENENVADEGIRLQRFLLPMSSGSSACEAQKCRSRGDFDP
jgi:hypothetical protein